MAQFEICRPSSKTLLHRMMNWVKNTHTQKKREEEHRGINTNRHTIMLLKLIWMLQ